MRPQTGQPTGDIGNFKHQPVKSDFFAAIEKDPRLRSRGRQDAVV
jgi:hypothetical protein